MPRLQDYEVKGFVAKLLDESGKHLGNKTDTWLSAKRLLHASILASQHAPLSSGKKDAPGSKSIAESTMRQTETGKTGNLWKELLPMKQCQSRVANKQS